MCLDHNLLTQLRKLDQQKRCEKCLEYYREAKEKLCDVPKLENVDHCVAYLKQTNHSHQKQIKHLDFHRELVASNVIFKSVFHLHKRLQKSVK